MVERSQYPYTQLMTEQEILMRIAREILFWDFGFDDRKIIQFNRAFELKLGHFVQALIREWESGQDHEEQSSNPQHRETTETISDL